MLKKTHVTLNLTLSLSTLLLTNHIQPLTISVPLLLGIYLGSFLPDIDNPHAKINHKLSILGHYFAKHHRGITHSLIAIGFWLVILLLLFQYTYLFIGKLTFTYCLGITIGYILHLIEDDFSVQGVLWLYPITKFKLSQNNYGKYKMRNFHWYFYYTGGTFETIFRYGLYPILSVLIYKIMLELI